MDSAARVRQIINENINVKREMSEQLAESIASGANHDVLTCGNDGSTADAQHFSWETLNRVERKEAGLPTIALTTSDVSTLTSIAATTKFADPFGKQLRIRAGARILPISERQASRAAACRRTEIHTAGCSQLVDARIGVHVTITRCLSNLVEPQMLDQETLSDAT
ncbi:MAG: SIS domain-containing protein [Chromatiales bacterium]